MQNVLLVFFKWSETNNGSTVMNPWTKSLVWGVFNTTVEYSTSFFHILAGFTLHSRLPATFSGEKHVQG